MQLRILPGVQPQSKVYSSLCCSVIDFAVLLAASAILLSIGSYLFSKIQL